MAVCQSQTFLLLSSPFLCFKKYLSVFRNDAGCQANENMIVGITTYVSNTFHFNIAVLRNVIPVI